MKSALVAYWVAWMITKDPTLRVLYISSTANLAEKQLGFIKNIITSSIYRRYWPEHTHVDEGKRTRWTATEISLDHPSRKKENVRDPTVFTGGLTTNLVGMHCDIAVLDDVVTDSTAYTEEGRRKVRLQYSLLASIEGAGAREMVVGTRYHPKDLYNDMLEMVEVIYDDEGFPVDQQPIYEVLERQVEDIGDGTGEFLWPRQQRKDGKWFGFDQRILSTKRGKYLDRTQFHAQYYNNPHDPDSRMVSNFEYYDKRSLRLRGADWYHGNNRLNLVTAIDFAYSKRKKADFTAIVVIGVDEDDNIYVLDIDRFKTVEIKEYFERLRTLINRWSFNHLVVEATAAQAAIVQELKNSYLRPSGLHVKIDEVKPTRHEGSKEERMEAVLSPLYQAGKVLHYRGGNTQILEEELSSYNSAHDDVKDALTNAISFRKKPIRRKTTQIIEDVIYNRRFGGRV
jgi:predicted phage terminase large subunit-like protein